MGGVRILSFAAFLLGVAVLVATALDEDGAPARLGRLRVAGAGAAAVLIASNLLDVASGIALGAACGAFVLFAQSIWLAKRRRPPLRACLDRLTAQGDAAWREDFERPFAAYVRKHGSGSVVARGRRR